MNQPIHSTWAEIDLAALRHNYRQLKRMAGSSSELLPVVKGEAYGHGMLAVAGLLDKLGVNFFGVSDVGEGIALREHGIKKNILLFESTLPEYAPQIVKFNLTPTICTLELARALDRQARKHNRKIDIHVEIDTGMGRLGVWHEDAVDFIGKLMKFPNLSIKGLYTHFPVAESDRNFTKKQVNNLYRVVTALDKKGLVVPFVHAANSMGLYSYRTRILNLVRPGLMLYGLYPKPQLKKIMDLKPVLSVKSKIMFIKKVAKGRSISYGRTFIARKSMTVATLPIGYRDGYFRVFSNKASVIVAGRRCPIVGRVTMDQIMIDVSKVPGIRLGMNVTVLGREKRAEVSADELAQLAGTINYEIVTSLGNRLPRIFS